MPLVSLREIAEKVGCSRSTVSYALKNHPSISAKMRDRIKKVAEDLGWHPNAELAQHMSLVRNTLSASSLPNLAIIINMSNRDLNLGFAPRYQLKGAMDYAEKRGYSVNVFNLVEQPLSASRLKSILKARGIQGIIYIGTVAPGIPLEYLVMGHDFSCAVVGVRHMEVPFHMTLPDWTSTARLAILNVLRLGYKRPGVIVPKELDRALGWGFSSGVVAGMMDVQEKHRLPVLLVGEDESKIPEYERDRCVEWIQENRPDAILTTDCREMPIILDDARLARRKRPPIYSLSWNKEQPVDGGIDERHVEVGRAAVDLVVAQLHRRESGIPEVQQAVLIEGIWVDGNQDTPSTEGESAKKLVAHA